MTERKKLEAIEVWKQNGEYFRQKDPFDMPSEPGTWINCSKKDLLDAFHEVYLQGQRDRENGVLSAPNLFNILNLKE